jgi:hypothetical protein
VVHHVPCMSKVQGLIPSTEKKKSDLQSVSIKMLIPGSSPICKKELWREEPQESSFLKKFP